MDDPVLHFAWTRLCRYVMIRHLPSCLILLLIPHRTDVNYGGSTGYGTKFRERLDKNWGIVDVQDTIACVDYLVAQGKADPKRVGIVGGSAGEEANPPPPLFVEPH